MATLELKRAASGGRPRWHGLLLGVAPVVAVLTGVASHVLDGRQLLLIPMGLAVLATSFALTRGTAGWPTLFAAVGVGALAWGGAQIVYVIAHTIAGEPFEAERFGPQWSQAIALIIAHAVFLGVPTGAVAGLLLCLPPLRRMRNGAN